MMYKVSALMMNHFSLRGGFVLVTSSLKFLYDFKTSFGLLDGCDGPSKIVINSD